jgi:hypothetical protein
MIVTHRMTSLVAGGGVLSRPVKVGRRSCALAKLAELLGRSGQREPFSRSPGALSAGTCKS